VCALLSAACGGGSAATSQHVSTSTARHTTHSGPCQGDRPILFLEGAVCADGTAVSVDETTGAGNSWSPTGEEQAFVTANAKTLKLRSQSGAEHVLYRAPKRVSLVHRTAWSPDGATVAVLMLDATGFNGGIVLGTHIPAYRPSLAVIDAQTGRLRRRIALSPSIVNMPYITNPPDTLAFAPDGSRVLISWDSPAVADLRTGHVDHLWQTPAVAAWSPTGQVIFLDVIGRQRFGALYSWSASAGAQVIMSEDAVRQAGIIAEHGFEYGQMRLSPDGRTIAIRTTQNGKTGIAVATWTGTGIGDDLKPLMTSGAVWDFDWSPDSSRIAAVVVDGSTADVEMLQTDNGTWTTLSTIPISIDGPDTIDALGPIKKIGWSG